MTSPRPAAAPPTLSIDGAVARITLSRPEQHNAIEAADVELLRAHLDRIDAEPQVRALVLNAHGPTFCAGASLREIESGALTAARFETLTDRLAAVRVPTICALNGSVYGGGTEIALCCDLRIGVVGMRMSVPAARLGLCYPVGGLRRYVEALGLGAAGRLLLTGEELGAEEMLTVGFLHRLVREEDLMAVTEALAARIASLAPLAVQGMKRILRQIARGQVDEEEAERSVAACAASADLREGLAARRERRDPEFRGN